MNDIETEPTVFPLIGGPLCGMTLQLTKPELRIKLRAGKDLLVARYIRIDAAYHHENTKELSEVPINKEAEQPNLWRLKFRLRGTRKRINIYSGRKSGINGNLKSRELTMDWLWYVVAAMFVITLFTLPVIAVAFMWQAAKEEAAEEAIEDNKPQQCDYCSCDCSELFEVDLGGEHG